MARNSAGANDSYYYNIIPSNVVKCSYLVEILEDRVNLKFILYLNIKVAPQKMIITLKGVL